ncbi:MAG: AAA family ATPase [Candidatus Omnitrophica bacterium]|nr:AAA family ATPase [Candidatus Omnitrophota bacterium]
MYTNYLGLEKEPFNVTPETDFLFLSPSHREAFAAVKYGIEYRKGFITLIGEVGAGKTTIVRSYLKQSDPERVAPIYIFNADLTYQQLLQTIFQELEVSIEQDDVYWMTRQLSEVLIDYYQKGKIVVLILDEAQNTPVETLEQLRMLTNLETRNAKLLQILLIGQPELAEILGRHELRQFKQRISVRAYLNALTPKESAAYIDHRIAASTNDVEAFTFFEKKALRRIIKHAQGIPRLINILCDNALAAAMGYQSRIVTNQIAKEVIRDFEKPWINNRRLSPLNRFVKSRWVWAPAAACLLMIGAAYFFGRDERLHPIFASLSLFNESQSTDLPFAVNEHLPKGEKRLEDAEKSSGSDSSDERAPVQNSPNSTSRIASLDRVTSASSSPLDAMESLIAAEIHDERHEPPQETSASMPLSDWSVFTMAPAPDEESFASSLREVPPELSASEDLSPASRASTTNLGDAAHPLFSSQELIQSRPKTFPIIVRVKERDTLQSLCNSIYGATGNALIEQVKSHNKNIENADLIFAGDAILFPTPNFRKNH